MSNTPKRKSRAGTRAAPPTSRTMTGQPVGSNWPKRFLYLGGAAVVAVIMAGIVLGGGDEDLPDGPPQGVEFFTVTDLSHVDGNVDYGVPVPTGGPMSPQTAGCGFVDGPVRTENVMHSLEHGAVWLTYRRDLGETGIDDLRGLTRDRRKVLVSEVPDQPQPLMATAWGVQLGFDDYQDEPVRRFIRAYVDSELAPEPGGFC